MMHAFITQLQAKTPPAQRHLFYTTAEQVEHDLFSFLISEIFLREIFCENFVLKQTLDISQLPITNKGSNF